MLTKEEIEWIKSHSKEDTAKLRLKYRGDIRTAYLIDQIDCRRKAAAKLRHTLQNEAFEFPTELSQEQSTSDRLARFHTSLVAKGSTVADLTAGLGIDALHMARKCLNVTAVEIDSHIAATLRDNALVLGINNLEVLCGDCTSLLPQMGEYDSMFIDPARRGEHSRRLYALSECHPDVVAMIPEIKKHTGQLIAKISPMLDISDVCSRLSPYITGIIALGDRRECKELIAICDLSREHGKEPEIKAVTLCPDDTEHEFSFTRTEEAAATADFGDPHPGLYLIDPYPSVMKTAPWRLLCSGSGMTTASNNTHIYFSPSVRDDIGESYLIEEVLPYSSGEIKRLARRWPQASVATRNFPLRADDLRRKLKVRDSNDVRLYGITDSNRKPLMVICRTIARQ